MDNKICPECNTVNEPQYSYCKNCGAPLKSEQNSGTYNYNSGNTGSDNFGVPYGYAADEIDGVPTGDLVCFVGKNSYKIIDKWSMMQFSRRKTSWCWPAFLLTIIFGFAGAGFWFLYRRMYKLGAVVLALALLLGGIQTFAFSDSFVNIISEIWEDMEEQNGEISDEWLNEKSNELTMSEDMMKLTFSSRIFGILETVSAVLAGLFSLHLYKNFAVNKIKGYGRPLSDIELCLAGGTSAGGVVLGALLYGIASFFMGIVFVVFMFSAVL